MDNTIVLGKIDLKTECFSKWLDRLQAWIILTDEYGKPSERFIDDFIYNFGDVIKNGNFNVGANIGKTLDKNFLNDENIRFTGGYEFYTQLNNKTTDEVREFISTYTYNEIQEITTGIEVESIEEIDEINELDEATEEDGEWSMLLDRLQHSVRLRVKGTTRDRGDFDGVIEYNHENKSWKILAGTKMCNHVAPSLYKPYTQILRKLMNDGTVCDTTCSFKRDYIAHSLSEATRLITLRSNSYDNVYLDEQIDGEEFTLLEVLENEILYGMCIGRKEE